MFGYVTPMKPELKVKDFYLFKSYYCGLCFSIKDIFGNIPRMALNYDMTFLAILLDGLRDENLKIEQKRCMAHLTKKKPVILDNEAINYAASMNISLFYYKLLDDKLDDNSLKSKFALLALNPYRKKFSKEIIEINSIISDNLNKLTQLENSKDFTSIDEICHPFSLIVGFILSKYPYKLAEDSKELRSDLFNFGYSLGKWIYLIDALDDLKEDMEKNKFNPISYLYNIDNLPYNQFKPMIKERLEFNILSCACTCDEYFMKLPLKKNEEIIGNIISLGMMDKYTRIINDCNCDKKERNFSNESI